MAKIRGSWGSKIGFMLAATGSAIGLGNIWKFPYITGEYGGGAFVLVYLGCIAVVGLPLMYAELSIGQSGQSDPVGSMTSLVKSPVAKGYGFLVGFMGVLSGFLILSFYSVIAGWAIHFLLFSLQDYPGGAAAVGGELGILASAEGGLWSWSFLWHSVFMLLTIGIVSQGVEKGVELASKIMMPALAVLLCVLMVIALQKEGGPQAIDFMFRPDWSSLSAEAVLEALGHAFFTLSLGMGAMITYGSYLKREGSIVKEALAISLMDTVIALMAGLAIFSITFTYGLEPGAGPGLLFTTLPVQFAEMQGGQFFGSAFFLLVVFAALTSAISLLEVVTAFVVDRFRIPRPYAALGFGLVVWGIGALSVFDMGTLDLLDQITTNYTLPIGGMCIAIFAGFLMSREQAASGMGEGLLFSLWLVMVRFVTPLLVLLVILHKLEVLHRVFALVGLEGLLPAPAE